jgi:hypothetical protein
VPHGTLTNQILARHAVHALAQPLLAVLGQQAGVVKLRHEIVQVVVGLKDDAAAAPAIAAAGAALGTVGFAQEGDASLAAVAGAGIDFYFIDKQKIRRGR